VDRWPCPAHRAPLGEVYKWTTKNNYFLVGMEDALGFGGGGGFALWLDANFNHGHSNRCDTYGSPVLGAAEEFRISEVEAWCFDKKVYNRMQAKRPDFSLFGGAHGANAPPSPTSSRRSGK
jgi:hypothetical protein